MLKLNKISPVFNQILTTKDVYDYDTSNNGVVVNTRGTMKMYQKVLAVGPSVKSCQVGDVVMLKPDRYGVAKHESGSMKDGVVEDNMFVKFNIPTITVNGQDCLLIYDNDISFILDDFTDGPDAPDIYVAPDPVIIQ